MEAFVASGAGFLLAVLWFDLMHDVQVRGHDDQEELPEPVLASIGGYYARVTTGARPMNRLVACVMLATVAGVGVEIASGFEPAWLPGATLLFVVLPIALAGSRTLPAAVRLGTRRDGPAEQSRLARRIFKDHVACLGSVTLVLALQLGSASG